VADADAQRRFLREGMGASDGRDGAMVVGNTPIFVVEDPSQERATPAMRRGFTYITLIVHDLDVCHRELLDAGAEHSLRALRLADRCLFSWVRDPHGNWIEIVQYADAEGSLPDIDRIADHWDEVIRWRTDGVPSGVGA
jgi:hypothetical protein